MKRKEKFSKVTGYTRYPHYVCIYHNGPLSIEWKKSLERWGMGSEEMTPGYIPDEDIEIVTGHYDIERKAEGN